MGNPLKLSYGQLKLSYGQPVSLSRTHLLATYCIEGLFSISGNLLFVGIFFYTTTVYHWGIVQNLLLAAGQGLAYIPASLVSQRLKRKLGPRKLILFASAAAAAVTLAGAIVQTQGVFIGVILAYVPLLALNWPVLESQVSAGADAHEMSRRIGVYNLVWAGTGAVAFAAQGTILKLDPRWVFIIPTAIHVGTMAIVLSLRGFGRAEPEAANDAEAHPAPEPELVRHRTLALWLSRIALPSTYVVIYALSALMPLLPVVKRLDPSVQTLLGSTWMASRWFVFWALGATVFWHTRPMLLLWAAALLLPAFLGTTLQTSDWLGGPLSIDVAAMILAQIALGAAVGMIYTASLYFGLVLSDGSTEHAGYHEALIGLGQTVGPLTAALTQWKWPGSLEAGVSAVAAIILASVALAGVAAVKARRREAGVPLE